MKLVVACSRGITVQENILDSIINDILKLPVSEIVSGNCQNSSDSSGEYWALAKGININLFPADWDTHGNSAGPFRNKQMAEYADAALIFWDGKSRGSKNMADHMHRKKKPVYVVKSETKETEDEIVTIFKYNQYIFSTKRRKLSDV